MRRYADASVAVTPVRGHPSLINTATEVEQVGRLLRAEGAGSADHHAPRFNPDPTVFWRGVHYWLILATAAADAGRA